MKPGNITFNNKPAVCINFAKEGRTKKKEGVQLQAALGGALGDNVKNWFGNFKGAKLTRGGGGGQMPPHPCSILIYIHYSINLGLQIYFYPVGKGLSHW